MISTWYVATENSCDDFRLCLHNGANISQINDFLVAVAQEAESVID